MLPDNGLLGLDEIGDCVLDMLVGDFEDGDKIDPVVLGLLGDKELFGESIDLELFGERLLLDEIWDWTLLLLVEENTDLFDLNWEDEVDLEEFVLLCKELPDLLLNLCEVPTNETPDNPVWEETVGWVDCDVWEEDFRLAICFDSSSGVIFSNFT